MSTLPRMLETYRNDVRPALVERFEYDNPMAVPKVEKVVISMGIGDAHGNAPRVEEAIKHLTVIAGQKPIVTRARKSVSNFKVRAGWKAGLKVTLRGARMYEFLDRLISLAIPRVRDFRGLKASGFDGRGNYNMGLDEQTVFPEIDPGSVKMTQGMNISIATSAQSDEEARELLSRLGMPFRREG
jgi:large subunit ribosomal protein L5